MRITVLGKSPAWQDAGGACSGYLIEHGDVTVLMECGNGVFGKLRELHDYTSVDAVIVSHMHADHFFDLIPYAFALTYSPRQQPVPVTRFEGTDHPARPRLHLPPGGVDRVNRATAAIDAPELVPQAFETSEYDPAGEVVVGDLTFRFREVPHFMTAHAIAVSQPDGKRFVFGADCRPNDAIVDFAQSADLLMLEATLPRPERTGVRGHLTPSEAGDHAKQAGAERLVLTHISDELDSLWALHEAEAAFGGPVTVATDGATYGI